MKLELTHPNYDVSLATITTDVDVEFAPQAVFLESILKKTGIHIPKDRLPDFGNRKVVHFQRNDGIFAKAFVEVYFPNSLRESQFKLTEIIQNVSNS
jgi:hypothetical protein